MDKNLKERRRLKISIGLAKNQDFINPPALTPTFVIPEAETCPVISDREVQTCSKCSFYQGKLKMMQENARKSEEMIKNLNLELIALKDLHKSSTVHAMMKKLDLQSTEVQSLSQRSVIVTEENSFFKEKILKSEKEIEYLKQNMRKTIKDLTSRSRRSSKTCKILAIHSFSLIPDPFFSKALTDGHENCKIFITEQKEENDERFKIQVIPEILNTESTKAPNQTKPEPNEQDLKKLFFQLSTDFSELVILFQSFVDLILFNNSFSNNKKKEELEKFEEKTDSKKVIFHLLTSINQKLVTIKQVFHLVESWNQGQDLTSSSASNFSQADEKIERFKSKVPDSNEILRKYSDFITNSSGFIEESSVMSNQEVNEKVQNLSKNQLYSKLDKLKKKIKKLKKEKRAVKRKVKNEIDQVNKLASEYIQIIHLEAKRLASQTSTEKIVFLNEIKQKNQQIRMISSENMKLKQEIIKMADELNSKKEEVENFEKTQKKLKNKIQKLEDSLENVSKFKEETSTLEFLQDKEASSFPFSQIFSQNSYSKHEIKKESTKTSNDRKNLQLCLNCQENNEKILVLGSENEMLHNHIANIEEQLNDMFEKIDVLTEVNRLAEENLDFYMKKLGFEQLKGAILKLKLEKMLFQLKERKIEIDLQENDKFLNGSYSSKDPKIKTFSRISPSREELF